MLKRDLLLLPCLLWSACAPQSAVSQRSAPIIGGVLDPGDPGVVMILVQDAQDDSFTVCTGEVVSPHVVLTAAHCLTPVTSGITFQIFTGTDFDDPAQQGLYIPVQATHFDPAYDDDAIEDGHDIGAVITQTALSAPPLPMNRTPLTSAMIGQPVRMVGYGITSVDDVDGETSGVKRQVSHTLTGYSTLFVESGDLYHNTCEGDSGGPILMTIGGVEVIVALASYGDFDCDGNMSTRVDTYAASYVDPLIAQWDPASPPTPGMPDAGVAPPSLPDAATPPPACTDDPACTAGVPTDTAGGGCSAAPAARATPGAFAIVLFLLGLIVVKETNERAGGAGRRRPRAPRSAISP